MPVLDRDKVWKEFGQAVNMVPAELAAWLETGQSREVGWKGPDGKGEDESVGHASGRRIVGMLGKPKAALTDEDCAHMRETVGYVRRHLARRPETQVTSRWRYALMNWGHDPIAG